MRLKKIRAFFLTSKAPNQLHHQRRFPHLVSGRFSAMFYLFRVGGWPPPCRLGPFSWYFTLRFFTFTLLEIAVLGGKSPYFFRGANNWNRSCLTFDAQKIVRKSLGDGPSTPPAVFGVVNGDPAGKLKDPRACWSRAFLNFLTYFFVWDFFGIAS